MLPVTGVAFLPAVLGAAARLAVEVAWGADLTDSDGSGWTWADLTNDVRLAPGITITIGRQDETSTTPPARCSFTLSNSVGAYTPYNPLGANYPNVRRGTPVRVRVTLDGTTWFTRFQGYVTSWGRDSAQTGTNATVAVTASGVLQRLTQSPAPKSSGYTTTLAASPLAYWPGDDGTGATSARSAVIGGSPLVPIAGGAPVFGSASPPAGYTGAVGMSAAPVMSGQINGATGTTAVTWEFWAKFTSSASINIVLPVYLDMTGGDIWAWSLGVANSVPSNQVYVNCNATSVGAGTFVTATAPTAPFDDQWHMYTVVAGVSAGTAFSRIYIDGVDVSTPFGATAVGGMGRPTRATTIKTITGPTDRWTAMAGLAVWDFDKSAGAADRYAAGAARLGETPYARAARLLGEANVDISVVDSNPSTGRTMGAQPDGTLPTLLREAEAADAAMIYDGLSPGIRWHSIAQRYNQSAALTIAATELAEPPRPVDNDQRLRNRAVVSRPGGSSAIAEDTAGDLGTVLAGTYEASITINLQDDSQLDDRAQWEVHAGTAPGERFPSLAVDCKNISTLASRLLATTNGWTGQVVPGWRLDLTGLSGVGVEYATGDTSLVIEGWTEILDPVNQWRVAFNVSPQDIYNAFKIGDVTRGRVAPDGHTLAAAAAAGTGSELGVATGTFEAGVSGWTPTAGTFVQSSAQKHTGTFAGLLTASGGTQALTRPTLVTVAAGSWYRLTFWAYSPVGFAALATAIDWYTTGVYTSTSSTTTSIPAATWTKFTLDAAAPLGVNGATYGPTLTGAPAAGTTLYLDDVTFVGTLALATPAGKQLWTAVPADFPLNLSIAGIKVTVTAISGTSSPQVAVVDGTTVTKALASGAPLAMWKNGVIKL